MIFTGSRRMLVYKSLQISRNVPVYLKASEQAARKSTTSQEDCVSWRVKFMCTSFAKRRHRPILVSGFSQGLSHCGNALDLSGHSAYTIIIRNLLFRSALYPRCLVLEFLLAPHFLWNYKQFNHSGELHVTDQLGMSSLKCFCRKVLSFLLTNFTNELPRCLYIICFDIYPRQAN